jgi:hypothetical protein
MTVKLAFAQLHRIATDFTSTSSPRILLCSASGPVTVTPKVALQHRDAFDMVGVMMGDENFGQGPAAPPRRLLDRLGVGCVDRGGLAGRRVVNEITVIVGAGGEDVDEDGHEHVSPGALR